MKENVARSAFHIFDGLCCFTLNIKTKPNFDLLIKNSYFLFIFKNPTFQQFNCTFIQYESLNA